MSKEEEFKLLSKEEIEKERIKAYEYIDMNKEQTPLSEEDEKALHLDAEDHYNEVIKPKYLNK